MEAIDEMDGGLAASVTLEQSVGPHSARRNVSMDNKMASRHDISAHNLDNSSSMQQSNYEPSKKKSDRRKQVSTAPKKGDTAQNQIPEIIEDDEDIEDADIPGEEQIKPEKKKTKNKGNAGNSSD